LYIDTNHDCAAEKIARSTEIICTFLKKPKGWAALAVAFRQLTPICVMQASLTVQPQMDDTKINMTFNLARIFRFKHCTPHFSPDDLACGVIYRLQVTTGHLGFLKTNFTIVSNQKAIARSPFQHFSVGTDR